MKTNAVRGLFIAGTDTGVGKTVVTAAVLAVLRAGGVDAAPMKPVQTGCGRRKGTWLAPDLEFCLRAADLNPNREEKRAMAPYCLAMPASPHLAAAGEGRRISLRTILAAFQRLSNGHDCVVVEGAGGILVPLNGKDVLLDLIRRLRLPVVLVARPGLGTINHTLLSLRELRRAQAPILGVVFNHTTASRCSRIEQDNRETIRKLGQVEILGDIPFRDDLKKLASDSAAWSAFSARVLPSASGLIRRLKRNNYFSRKRRNAGIARTPIKLSPRNTQNTCRRLESYGGHARKFGESILRK